MSLLDSICNDSWTIINEYLLIMSPLHIRYLSTLKTLSKISPYMKSTIKIFKNKIDFKSLCGDMHHKLRINNRQCSICDYTPFLDAYIKNNNVFCDSCTRAEYDFEYDDKISFKCLFCLPNHYGLKCTFCGTEDSLFSIEHWQDFRLEKLKICNECIYHARLIREMHPALTIIKNEIL